MTGRRQRGLRFVENEDALAAATLLKKAEKSFAVRVREKVGRRRVYIKSRSIQIARHGEKAFCTEEPTVGDLGKPRGAECLGERAAHYLDGIRVIDGPIALTAAGFVISGQHRNPFEQRRFPRPVFSNDDGNRPVEIEFESVMEERQTKRIGRGIVDARLIKPYSLEIWRWQSARAALHRTARVPPKQFVLQPVSDFRRSLPKLLHQA